VANNRTGVPSSGAEDIGRGSAIIIAPPANHPFYILEPTGSRVAASAGLGNWTHLFMAYLNSQAGNGPVKRSTNTRSRDGDEEKSSSTPSKRARSATKSETKASSGHDADQSSRSWNVKHEPGAQQEQRARQRRRATKQEWRTRQRRKRAGAQQE
jgi:hypothetical protein